MARDDNHRQDPETPAWLDSGKTIRLLGPVDKAMVEALQKGLDDAAPDEDLIVEITSSGGDAELGRRMVLEIDRARARRSGRLVFLGATEVYSAAATLMSAFPVADRFLTADAVLLIHSRQLKKTVELDGPIGPSLTMLKSLVEQIEVGIKLEQQGFERLIEGSNVGMDMLMQRALHNWYVTAAEACDLKLVAGIV